MFSKTSLLYIKPVLIIVLRTLSVGSTNSKIRGCKSLGVSSLPNMLSLVYIVMYMLWCAMMNEIQWYPPGFEIAILWDFTPIIMCFFVKDMLDFFKLDYLTLIFVFTVFVSIGHYDFTLKWFEQINHIYIYTCVNVYLCL